MQGKGGASKKASGWRAWEDIRRRASDEHLMRIWWAFIVITSHRYQYPETCFSCTLPGPNWRLHINKSQVQNYWHLFHTPAQFTRLNEHLPMQVVDAQPRSANAVLGTIPAFTLKCPKRPKSWTKNNALYNKQWQFKHQNLIFIVSEMVHDHQKWMTVCLEKMANLSSIYLLAFCNLQC